MSSNSIILGALMALSFACVPDHECVNPCLQPSRMYQPVEGIVCECDGTGSYTQAPPPPGVLILDEEPGRLLALFPRTMNDDVCAADQQWWSERAPAPCIPPGGGGGRRQQP